MANWKDSIGDKTRTIVSAIAKKTTELSPEQRQEFDYYIIATAVVLSAYFISDLGSIGLQMLANKSFPSKAPSIAKNIQDQSTPHKKSIDQFGVIFSRNLFNSHGLIPEDDGTQPSTAPAIRTALPWNLIGVLILQDPEQSLGTIEDKTAQDVYPVRMGDEVPFKSPLARIIGIEKRRVLFYNLQTKQNEYVELPDDPLAANPMFQKRISKTSGKPTLGKGGITKFNIPKKEMESALSNLSLVLTQARAVPSTEGGFKLIQIVPGSIYDKIGLKNDDVVCGLNGEEMTDASKAIELLGTLREASHLELCVKRNGQEMQHVYDIQ